MQEEIDKLKNQVQILQLEIGMLRSSSSIPFDVENAFRERLEPVSLFPSTKATSTETQAVNEGGIATYNVAKPMDGFEERVVDGVTRYYPYYL